MYSENLFGLAEQLARSAGYIPPDKRRMGEAIREANNFMIRSTVNDLTHNPHKIDALKRKIDASFKTLETGSGRLHNDLTFFGLAADIDLRRRNIKRKFEEHKRRTHIKSINIGTYDSSILDMVSGSKRVELNIFERKIIATQNGLQVEGVNVKIFPDEENKLFIRLRELTSNEDESTHICPQLTDFGIEPLRVVNHQPPLNVREYSLFIPLENHEIWTKTETIMQRVVAKIK